MLAGTGVEEGLAHLMQMLSSSKLTDRRNGMAGLHDFLAASHNINQLRQAHASREDAATDSGRLPSPCKTAEVWISVVRNVTVAIDKEIHLLAKKFRDEGKELTHKVDLAVYKVEEMAHHVRSIIAISLPFLGGDAVKAVVEYILEAFSRSDIVWRGAGLHFCKMLVEIARHPWMVECLSDKCRRRLVELCVYGLSRRWEAPQSLISEMDLIHSELTRVLVSLVNNSSCSGNRNVLDTAPSLVQLALDYSQHFPARHDCILDLLNVVASVLIEWSGDAIQDLWDSLPRVALLSLKYMRVNNVYLQVAAAKTLYIVLEIMRASGASSYADVFTSLEATTMQLLADAESIAIPASLANPLLQWWASFARPWRLPLGVLRDRILGGSVSCAAGDMMMFLNTLAYAVGLQLSLPQGGSGGEARREAGSERTPSPPPAKRARRSVLRPELTGSVLSAISERLSNSNISAQGRQFATRLLWVLLALYPGAVPEECCARWAEELLIAILEVKKDHAGEAPLGGGGGGNDWDLAVLCLLLDRAHLPNNHKLKVGWTLDHAVVQLAVYHLKRGSVVAPNLLLAVLERTKAWRRRGLSQVLEVVREAFAARVSSSTLASMTWASVKLMLMVASQYTSHPRVSEVMCTTAKVIQIMLHNDAHILAAMTPTERSFYLWFNALGSEYQHDLTNFVDSLDMFRSSGLLPTNIADYLECVTLPFVRPLRSDGSADALLALVSKVVGPSDAETGSRQCIPEAVSIEPCDCSPGRYCLDSTHIKLLARGLLEGEFAAALPGRDGTGVACPSVFHVLGSLYVFCSDQCVRDEVIEAAKALYVRRSARSRICRHILGLELLIHVPKLALKLLDAEELADNILDDLQSSLQDGLPRFVMNDALREPPPMKSRKTEPQRAVQPNDIPPLAVISHFCRSLDTRHVQALSRLLELVPSLADKVATRAEVIVTNSSSDQLLNLLLHSPLLGWLGLCVYQSGTTPTFLVRLLEHLFEAIAISCPKSMTAVWLLLDVLTNAFASENLVSPNEVVVELLRKFTGWIIIKQEGQKLPWQLELKLTRFAQLWHEGTWVRELIADSIEEGNSSNDDCDSDADMLDPARILESLASVDLSAHMLVRVQAEGVLSKDARAAHARYRSLADTVEQGLTPMSVEYGRSGEGDECTQTSPGAVALSMVTGLAHFVVSRGDQSPELLYQLAKAWRYGSSSDARRFIHSHIVSIRDRFGFQSVPSLYAAILPGLVSVCPSLADDPVYQDIVFGDNGNTGAAEKPIDDPTQLAHAIKDLVVNKEVDKALRCVTAAARRMSERGRDQQLVATVLALTLPHLYFAPSSDSGRAVRTFVANLAQKLDIASILQAHKDIFIAQTLTMVTSELKRLANGEDRAENSGDAVVSTLGHVCDESSVSWGDISLTALDDAWLVLGYLESVGEVIDKSVGAGRQHISMAVDESEFVGVLYELAMRYLSTPFHDVKKRALDGIWLLTSAIDSALTFDPWDDVPSVQLLTVALARLVPNTDAEDLLACIYYMISRCWQQVCGRAFGTDDSKKVAACAHALHEAASYSVAMYMVRCERDPLRARLRPSIGSFLKVMAAQWMKYHHRCPSAGGAAQDSLVLPPIPQAWQRDLGIDELAFRPNSDAAVRLSMFLSVRAYRCEVAGYIWRALEEIPGEFDIRQLCTIRRRLRHSPGGRIPPDAHCDSSNQREKEFQRHSLVALSVVERLLTRERELKASVDPSNGDNNDDTTRIWDDLYPSVYLGGPVVWPYLCAIAQCRPGFPLWPKGAEGAGQALLARRLGAQTPDIKALLLSKLRTFGLPSKVGIIPCHAHPHWPGSVETESVPHQKLRDIAVNLANSLSGEGGEQSGAHLGSLLSHCSTITPSLFPHILFRTFESSGKNYAARPAAQVSAALGKLEDESPQALYLFLAALSETRSLAVAHCNASRDASDAEDHAHALVSNINEFCTFAPLDWLRIAMLANRLGMNEFACMLFEVNLTCIKPQPYGEGHVKLSPQERSIYADTLLQLNDIAGYRALQKSLSFELSLIDGFCAENDWRNVVMYGEARPDTLDSVSRNRALSHLGYWTTVSTPALSYYHGLSEGNGDARTSRDLGDDVWLSAYSASWRLGQWNLPYDTPCVSLDVTLRDAQCLGRSIAESDPAVDDQLGLALYHITSAWSRGMPRQALRYVDDGLAAWAQQMAGKLTSVRGGGERASLLPGLCHPSKNPVLRAASMVERGGQVMAVGRWAIGMWKELCEEYESQPFDDFEPAAMLLLRYLHWHLAEEGSQMSAYGDSSNNKGDEPLIDTFIDVLTQFGQMARDLGRSQITMNLIMQGRRTHGPDVPSSLPKHLKVQLGLEEARTLWHNGARPAACAMLEQLINSNSQGPAWPGTQQRANTSELSALPSTQTVMLDRAIIECLCQAGEWYAQNRTLRPSVIVDEYFLGAAHRLKYGAISATPQLGAKAYIALARFADAQLKEFLGIFNDKSAAAIRQYKQEELGEIKRRITRLAGQDARKVLALKRFKRPLELIVEADLAERSQLEYNIKVYMRLAIKGYIRALRTTSEYDHYIYSLVALWLANADNPVANTELKESSVGKVPFHKFIKVFPQLAAHIATPSMSSPTFQDNLITVISGVLELYPYHTMYSLLAFCNASKTGLSFTSDARRRYSGGADTLQSQLDARDRNRGEMARRLIEGARQNNGAIVASIEATCDAYIAFAEQAVPESYCRRSAGSKRGDIRIPIPRNAQIMRLVTSYGSEVPAITADLPVIPVGSAADTDVPLITSLESYYQLVGGINLPKVLRCVDSKGLRHKQLVKNKDDLRQDAVIQQLFGVMNDLFDRQSAAGPGNAYRRRTRVRTYRVVPLTRRSGVVQWVDNTLPIAAWVQQAGPRYAPESLPFEKCFKKINAGQRNARQEDKVRVFKEVLDKTRPVLRYFFYEKFLDPRAWLISRDNYTCSVATSSIAGWVLGIGDRHSHNILLDEITGEVIHIDLGIAFDQGKLLPVPEVVPFRLTREVVDGMGYIGTDGMFKQSAISALQTLKQSTNMITTVLSMLKYDPLYQWTISVLNQRKITLRHDAVYNQATGNHQLDSELESIDSLLASSGQRSRLTTDSDESISSAADLSNKDAERAIIQVTTRLQATISPEGQVNELIQAATDPENLCRMFIGWKPWQ